MIQPVKEKIILGIDPGTTIMGYGVLRVKGTKPEMIAMGIIDLRKFANHYLKLRHIHERVLSIIESYLPDELAIEAPFFGKNVQSMLKLGRAQGVAMAVALSRDIPITEYAPLKIKMLIVGPPHGRIFITPAPSATIVARVVFLIPKASYRGSIAGTVTRNVTAPEPSRCTIIASIAVPIAILIGSLPTIFKILSIIGWKVPASVRIPKNKIAKINIVPVGAIDFTPSLIYFPIFNPCPPISAVITGTDISATNGDIFFNIITANSTMIVINPKAATIFSSLNFINIYFRLTFSLLKYKANPMP